MLSEHWVTTLGAIISTDSVNRFPLFSVTRREQTTQKWVALWKAERHIGSDQWHGWSFCFDMQMEPPSGTRAWITALRQSVLYRETETWTSDPVLLISQFGFFFNSYVDTFMNRINALGNEIHVSIISGSVPPWVAVRTRQVLKLWRHSVISTLKECISSWNLPQ
jgi:hypothetical protein